MQSLVNNSNDFIDLDSGLNKKKPEINIFIMDITKYFIKHNLPYIKLPMVVPMNSSMPDMLSNLCYYESLTLFDILMWCQNSPKHFFSSLSLKDFNNLKKEIQNQLLSIIVLLFFFGKLCASSKGDAAIQSFYRPFLSVLGSKLPSKINYLFKPTPADFSIMLSSIDKERNDYYAFWWTFYTNTSVLHKGIPVVQEARNLLKSNTNQAVRIGEKQLVVLLQEFKKILNAIFVNHKKDPKQYWTYDMFFSYF